MDFLDIDQRVNNAVQKVDQVAQARIEQIDQVGKARIEQLSQVFDEKIESIRLLLTGLSFSVNANQVKDAKPPV
jgi:predicted  nucleic acid-binding Zn-ribbon protein